MTSPPPCTHLYAFILHPSSSHFAYTSTYHWLSISPTEYQPQLGHNSFIAGLHKFLREISCTQTCFRSTSVHMRNRTRKRADVHVTNNNMIGWKEMYWIIIKTLGSCRLYHFSLDEGYPTFTCTTRSVNRSVAAARFLLNSIEKWCRKYNILTSSAAVYTLPNIIYLKNIKYLKIGLRQMY